MSFLDFFHKFFGSSHGENVRPPEYGNEDKYAFKTPKTPSWGHSSEEDDLRDFASTFNFKVVTDPFEMHQFFEKKMNEVFEMFMSPQGFPGISDFGFLESPDVPAIEDKPDPRNHYLKPGIDKTLPDGQNPNKKSDSIFSLFDMTPPPSHNGESAKPRVYSSFRSVVRRSVTLPDGTIQTEEIVRNSDGTEKRTETKTMIDGNEPDINRPFVNPDFSGFFDFPKSPEIKKTDPSGGIKKADLRDQLLKPGYEKYNPHNEKIDKDLDHQILQSGVESLPSFSEQPEPDGDFFSKSFRKITITLPNGAVESEEVVRNPDGTEQRTVTKTVPDKSAKAVEIKIEYPEHNKRNVPEDNSPSFAMRGVKDFISILFK